MASNQALLKELTERLQKVQEETSDELLKARPDRLTRHFTVNVPEFHSSLNRLSQLERAHSLLNQDVVAVLKLVKEIQDNKPPQNVKHE